jgi:hypothetical protein
MTDILNSILAIKSDAQVSVNAEDINQITWHDGNPNNKYQRDRAVAYPSIKDQLDDLYHNGIDGWKTTIKAVKDKYPKG